ncbi:MULTISPECIES: DUF2987 domain-containing protein [Alteromonadaceae]|uniref:DUF2987 domain-containing protein n=1 Tax=Alteromonadaceae TaxID=72275 RepID=UPI001C09725F|nr:MULTISPECIES: DUF2987 domain-containing protein [Aliiglaciecola]MBU2876360.1 DUF2987 domain-containing protein [Aliiglaciecola lipolytica]MDO6710576.1 DUF2987 domain-containing protein [Aliiglaciecola sp. 2_MG-2023]MDO6751559.1 DUF2987 domain-containing protein [Aliiglaciecola sp. 1_MG-2023]
MKILSFTLVLFSFCGLAFADTLSVEYSSFYSHLKKIDNEETPALQFAFGFKNVRNGDLCEIKTANIVTQKVTLPVTVTPENRFLLPTEKALSQAKAIVEFELLENNNQCDMSVQLETKPSYLKQQYTHQELQDLYQQYTVFFDDMGSFLSFLMPSVTGLQFYFDNVDRDSIPAEIYLDEHHAVITGDWLEQGNQIQFSEAPYRVTAITK